MPAVARLPHDDGLRAELAAVVAERDALAAELAPWRAVADDRRIKVALLSIQTEQRIRDEAMAKYQAKLADRKRREELNAELAERDPFVRVFVCAPMDAPEARTVTIARFAGEREGVWRIGEATLVERRSQIDRRLAHPEDDDDRRLADLLSQNALAIEELSVEKSLKLGAKRIARGEEP